MNTISKCILTILVMLAVLGYTVMNYINGKTDFTMFLVCSAIICIPLANMVNILIKEWKNK